MIELGTVLKATSFQSEENDRGEYRICFKCRHLFWSEWDDSDTPNSDCPYCSSVFTEFVGFDFKGDHDMQKIFANHPEEHPIIGDDEFQFTDPKGFSES